MGKWGGKQPGAGRPKGVANTRTQELIALAKERGIMPIEVMLENMRFWHDGGKAMTAKLAEVADRIRESGDENMMQEFFRVCAEVAKFRDKAQDCAVDAAPYCHPRLASINFTQKNVKDSPEVKQIMSPKDAAAAFASALDLMPEGGDEAVPEHLEAAE